MSKTTSPIEELEKSSAVIQAWLDKPIYKRMRCREMPVDVVESQLRAVPHLLKYLDYIMTGVRMFAETPNNGCQACKVASHIAADMLAGKDVQR